MDPTKYNREIRLMCTTCGGTQFECDETVSTDTDEQTIKCAQCNRETTRRMLQDENSENINAHVREIGRKVTKDVSKELSKIFKKIFK
jgi:hypothetical protein